MSKSDNYYEIGKEFFLDISVGILKDDNTITNIIDKLEKSLPVNLFQNVLIRVIHNAIYKEENDNGFRLLFNYYIDILRSSPNRLILDIRFRHPILHELAHQLPRTFNKFKLVWTNRIYKEYTDNQLYLDTYGLTAKQRLSSSYNFKDYVISKWILDNIGVIKTRQPIHDKYGNMNKPSDYLIECLNSKFAKTIQLCISFKYDELISSN